MTVATARDRVRLIIDREDTAYLSNDDIDGFVEMAVDEFVQQHYLIFETNQDARDKLQKLVVRETNNLSDSSNISIVNHLTNDYSRLLSIELNESPFGSIKVIQLSDLSAYTKDPFNKADSSNPVAYIHNDMISSIGLSSSVSVLITFLTQALLITDLSSYTHEEVCQMAARKVLATLGDPRYQILQAEVSERRG